MEEEEGGRAGRRRRGSSATRSRVPKPSLPAVSSFSDIFDPLSDSSTRCHCHLLLFAPPPWSTCNGKGRWHD